FGSIFGKEGRNCLRQNPSIMEQHGARTSWCIDRRMVAFVNAATLQLLQVKILCTYFSAIHSKAIETCIWFPHVTEVTPLARQFDLGKVIANSTLAPWTGVCWRLTRIRIYPQSGDVTEAFLV